MAENIKNFTIERLNNENYNTWSFVAEMLLRREDLWHCIDENALPLDVKWEKADGKALATIVLACERQQYSLIQSCKTSKDAWLALKNHHEKMSTPASAAAVKKWCMVMLRNLFMSGRQSPRNWSAITSCLIGDSKFSCCLVACPRNLIHLW